MNYTWITLLSSIDYLEAVLALNTSLNLVRSSYPLTVAITENLVNEIWLLDILKKENINIEFIKTYYYSDETYILTEKKQYDPSVLNTASKIGIFDLKWYDKIVYIDADTFFIKNADELFKYKDGSMILDPNSVDGLKWGFTGLMVIEPRNHYTELYKLLLEQGPYYDGDMFGRLWFHIRANETYQIPDIYLKTIPTDGIIEPDVKIYHMVNIPVKWWKKTHFSTSNIEQHYKKLLFYHRMTYKLMDKNNLKHY